MTQSQSVAHLVDHFFRNEFGKAVAILTNRFGAEMLEHAEDAVQEALYKAMQTWPYGTIPDNPSGWILKVATNKLLDHLRKAKKLSYEEVQYEVKSENLIEFQEGMKDDMVRMIFACCNPALTVEYQLILTLKILGGLSVREISSALMKKEETVAKSYTRAKKKFQSESLSLQLPDKNELAERLDRVLKVIYLLFNEGYKSTENDEVIRLDLCLDAIRLAEFLLEFEYTNTTATRSLLALMYLHSARFAARQGPDGELISLEDQDRSLWSVEYINEGNQLLNSIDGNEPSNEYLLQAAISAVHCNARTYEETQWGLILRLYTKLYQITQNPLIALNRVIPLLKTEGAAAAQQELEKLANVPSIQENYLLPAFKAEVMMAMNRFEEASIQLKRALKLTKNPNEKKYLEKKLTSIAPVAKT